MSRLTGTIVLVKDIEIKKIIDIEKGMRSLGFEWRPNLGAFKTKNHDGSENLEENGNGFNEGFLTPSHGGVIRSLLVHIHWPGRSYGLSMR